MRTLALAALLSLAPTVAHADDELPDQAGADKDVTVVAPPESPGLTVVAPTAQGGTVIAQGCKSATVTGAPVAIAAAPCPYQPYRPPAQVILLDSRRWKQLRKGDRGRTVALALSAVGFGLGGALTLFGYANELQCASGRPCQATAMLGLYSASMILFPAIPRLAVDEAGSAIGWSLAIGAAIGAGVLFDSLSGNPRKEVPGPAFIAFGVLGAGAIGVVELATTPHRDVRRKDMSISLSAAPLGTHGGAAFAIGSF